jgi:hypothetical protein
MYYVYLHYFSDSKEIFYIGKGCKKRAWSKHRSFVWKKLTEGREYVVSIIETELNELEAFEIEKKLIERYQPTGNVLPGGNKNGIVSSEYLLDFYKTEKGENKKKSLSSRMINWNPMKDSKLREKKRQENLGKNNFFHKLTETSKQKHKKNVSNAKMGSKNPRAKKCVLITTGQEYGSIAELRRNNKELKINSKDIRILL